MKFKQSISFFIPAYNEEDNLEAISKEIIGFLSENFEKYELIIVANVCKDRTSEIAQRLTRWNKHIRVVQQKKFVGYGTQLKAGWENAKYDLIFYTDSDRQFDISELKKFMRYINKYDIVIGYRKKRRDPLMRIWYSKLYNFALKVTLELWYKDVDCAFKLCKKEVIDKIKPITQDRGSDAEFLVKSKAYGFKIKQLPVTHRPRIAGVSEAESGGKIFVKIKSEIITAMIKEIFQLRKIQRKIITAK